MLASYGIPSDYARMSAAMLAIDGPGCGANDHDVVGCAPWPQEPVGPGRAFRQARLARDERSPAAHAEDRSFIAEDLQRALHRGRGEGRLLGQLGDRRHARADLPGLDLIPQYPGKLHVRVLRRVRVNPHPATVDRQAVLKIGQVS